nr:chloride channel protein [Ensifer sp. ENS05]
MVVSGIGSLSHALHSLLYGVPFAAALSGASLPRDSSMVLFPIAAGILTAALHTLRRRRGNIVDPIEANALYGGRMSLSDSLWLVTQNLVSNGFGLSAGLEAAYTQLSAAMASVMGRRLKLRREDMRVLVGCGAAGAIAAAFGAPLTGAFYAFELIIGSYSTVALAPVIGAAITGTLVAQAITGAAFTISIHQAEPIAVTDFLPAVAIGAVCAGLGILLMVTVVKAERLAGSLRIPALCRPAIGGVLVGCLALVTPQIMSAGHGAMHINIEGDVTWSAILALFALKALATAATIGSGFRGGLFFASLLLGALVGKLIAVPFEWVFPGLMSSTALAVIGMSAFGVAVIGGPLAMTFLALELTGEFPLAALVLAAAITSSLVTRQSFGYSFATWRFHLRGESIRSAHDVGWIRNLTVGRLMRHDVRTISASATPNEFREKFPVGSTQRVIAVNEHGRYVALIPVAEVHADALEATSCKSLSEFFRNQNDLLLPGMNARQAAAMFEACMAEALVVVEDRIERRILGLLSEAHTLRRYSEELEKQRLGIFGSTD